MSRPDEGLIHTWLDGECSAEEAARIERLVASDPAWAAAVAEARGLIAASSRIVSALDAVPAGVMPAGSKAAPELVAAPTPVSAPGLPARALSARDGFRVRPWMKMAAGLVLVAGTAYAIRGTTRDVFGPPGEMQTAATDAPAIVAADSFTTADAAVSDETATTAVSAAGQAAAQVGNLASTPAAGAGVRSAARAEESMVAKTAPVREQSAGRQVARPSAEPVGPPAVEAPAPAPATPSRAAPALAEVAPAAGASVAGASAAGTPTTGAPASRAAAATPTTSAEDRARRLAEADRRFAGALSQVVTTGTRGAAQKSAADSPALMYAVGQRLEGCWNISAPDSLRTLLRNPTFLRVTADTLMLEFVLRVERKVRVVQNADTLRGEITAKRVECPKP